MGRKIDFNPENAAKKLLQGRTITDVRYLSTEEAKELMWDKKCIVLHLDDGNLIYPSMDDEGNNGGALFTNDDNVPVIGTI